MVKSKIFRAYDVRGIYPDEINEETAYKLGRAFAIYLKENEIEKEKSEKVIVGCDARVSSPVLKRSFIEGLRDGCVNVMDLGMVTVDMVYFASGHLHLPAAMVTASHNPADYNGLKLMKSNVDFFDAREIEKILNKRLGAASPGKGVLEEVNIESEYLNHVAKFIDTEKIRPMKVAIDANSGSVGPVMKSILKKLPLECLEMNFSPNGNFPNNDPDPTKEKNITGLQNAVRTGHYHFGCAFDGDGDRIVFVDENGSAIGESIIGALMAMHFLKRRPFGKIVYSVAAGKIIPDVVGMYNGTAIRERVGHSFIKKRLKEAGGIFGIETSGHYFFKDNFYADSGIISFLTMLDILSNEKKSLSVLASELSKYYSLPEMNFKVEDQNAVIKKVAENFSGYDTDYLDGLTVRTQDFWFNLRPSNTESLIRLNVESINELILNRVKNDLMKLIKTRG